MILFKYLKAILLILACKFCFVSSDECVIQTSFEGTIEESRYSSNFEKCWKIIVPPGSFVQLSLESYTSFLDCPNSILKVTVLNRDEPFSFCPEESTGMSIIASDDVIINFVMNDDFHNFDSAFKMRYKIESLCTKKNSFKCSNNMCIPESRVCDGVQHCLDGTDEIGCGNGVFVIQGSNESREIATKWFKNKWSYSSGWQENTHRGIIAWYLATERNDTDVEEKLMVKQLEAETLASLLRNESSPLTVNQVSMFVNALTVSCRDPRNFHGFDLVKILKQQTEVSSLTSHPTSYLALCNAGESLPINATTELSKILNSDSEYPFLLDLKAATVMALSCLRHSSEDISNIPFPQTDFENTIERFKALQKDDGSFGNIYTSAIVTQALLSAAQESSKDWNLNTAVNHIMKHLNSSNVDFLATYLTLPILNGKALSDIRNTNCSGAFKQKYQGISVEGVKNKLGPKMRVQYSLYVGDEKDIIHTIWLRVPENITVYEVMQLAQVADNKYKFQWKKMGEKLYIYDIDNITNDFENGQFWLLYLGQNKESMTHLTESPDKVTLKDGSQIIMWYKRAHI
ncbi:uncharacterized protein CG3556 [Caerostris darwini]|uniref:Uncharacterized protein CG3556 n=1 Tax=Caerostris darwini TaxID=1538125 RepID=A0AAV4Q319_9ARAC|nr:uncharacterized protein CG3556 [Caerostris darwini]